MTTHKKSKSYSFNLFLKAIEKYAPTIVLTLASQLIAVAAIALMAFYDVDLSDMYSIGVQIGTLSYSGFVLGVIYLIVVGRPQFSGWRTTLIAASFVSLIAGALTFVFFHHFGTYTTNNYFIPTFFTISLFSVGGAFLASSGVYAVRESCRGNPKYMVTITIFPNLMMAFCVFICILFSFPLTVYTFTLPAFCWTAGSALQFLYFRKLFAADHKSTEDPPLISTDDHQRDDILVHFTGLIIGVVVSGLYPILYLSTVSTIGSGTATLLFFAARIGNAGVGLLVNSILMVKYKWGSKPSTSFRFVEILSFVSVCCALVSVLARELYHNDTVSIIVYMITWTCVIFSSPFLLREINFLKKSWVILFKALFDLSISTFALLYLTFYPSIAGYFVAFVGSHCVTLCVCSFALRRHLIFVFSATTAALSFLLLHVT